MRGAVTEAGPHGVLTRYASHAANFRHVAAGSRRLLPFAASRRVGQDQKPWRLKRLRRMNRDGHASDEILRVEALERHGGRGRRAGAGELFRPVRHLLSMVRAKGRSNINRL